MDTDSVDYGMEYDEDSLEETQQTQSTQQASQAPEDPVDEHLWGYLQPCSAALTRIDFWRIHPKYAIGRNTETNQVVLPGFKVSKYLHSFDHPI
jgi:serine/threonine/tyrosine protein kinase RAD53